MCAYNIAHAVCVLLFCCCYVSVSVSVCVSVCLCLCMPACLPVCLSVCVVVCVCVSLCIIRGVWGGGPLAPQCMGVWAGHRGCDLVGGTERAVAEDGVSRACCAAGGSAHDGAQGTSKRAVMRRFRQFWVMFNYHDESLRLETNMRARLRERTAGAHTTGGGWGSGGVGAVRAAQLSWRCRRRTGSSPISPSSMSE